MSKGNNQLKDFGWETNIVLSLWKSEPAMVTEMLSQAIIYETKNQGYIAVSNPQVRVMGYINATDEGFDYRGSEEGANTVVMGVLVKFADEAALLEHSTES